MGQFRFVVIGSPQVPVLDAEAADMDELHVAIEQSRFVGGRLVSKVSGV